MRALIALLLTSGLLAGSIGSAAAFQAPGVIAITAHGINQNDTPPEARWVLCPSASSPSCRRADLRMPEARAYADFSPSQREQLVELMATDIVNVIRSAGRSGATVVELQVVTDIGTASYALLDRQRLVDDFHNDVMRARERARARLARTIEGWEWPIVAASNDTKMAANNFGLLEWGDPLDFFDGRASSESVEAAIDAVGASNVRIFTSSGDLPAADRILANILNSLTARLPFWRDVYGDVQPAIANLNESKRLKRAHPELRVFRLGEIIDAGPGDYTRGAYLTEQGALRAGVLLERHELTVNHNPLPAWSSHVAGMAPENRSRLFLIEELEVDPRTNRSSFSRRAVILGADLGKRGDAFERSLIYLPRSDAEYVSLLADIDAGGVSRNVLDEELAVLEEALRRFEAYEATSGFRTPEGGRVLRAIGGHLRRAQSEMARRAGRGVVTDDRAAAPGFVSPQAVPRFEPPEAVSEREDCDDDDGCLPVDVEVSAPCPPGSPACDPADGVGPGSSSSCPGGSPPPCDDPPPGGVDLAPSMVVTLGADGLVDSVAVAATAAVGALSSGRAVAELRFGQERLIVARATIPSASQPDDVAPRHPTGWAPPPAGRFILVQADLRVADAQGRVLLLKRYFDSFHGEGDASPGWRWLPFRLELVAGPPSVGSAPASRVALLDRETGVRFGYELSYAPQPIYSGLSPYEQPSLSWDRSDGGYLVRFAGGSSARFDASGRLSWTEHEAEGDRVAYHHDGVGLSGLSRGDLRIDLVRESGVIHRARSSAGEEIRYERTADGAVLEAVVSFPGSVLRFGYDATGRVRTLNAGRDGRLVFENVYDSVGRVVTRRTSDGDWRFTHTDLPGGGSRIDVTSAEEPETLFYDRHGRLVAHGGLDRRVTLIRYERGTVAEVAAASVQEPGGPSRAPRFLVGDVVVRVLRENDRN